jgi:hypothetical protein
MRGTCSVCGHEPGAPEGCTPGSTVEFPAGTLARVPFEPDETNPHHLDPNRCRYCGVAIGGVHHLRCAFERCPNCDRYLMTCHCL